MGTNGTHRSHEKHTSLANPPTRGGSLHHLGLRPLLFSNSGVGSFTSHMNRSVKVLWYRTYGFSSLSEKTRKSNHLQMSLQRQHFLLSYFEDPECWSGWGLNPRPPAWQTGALPTELIRRRWQKRRRRRPEKDLCFNNVGRGIWKILHSCFFKNPCYTPVFYCWRVVIFVIVLEMRANSLP